MKVKAAGALLEKSKRLEVQEKRNGEMFVFGVETIIFRVSRQYRNGPNLVF